MNNRFRRKLSFTRKASRQKETIMIQKDQVEIAIRTHHRTKLKLHVPSLPSSNLQHCGIIELKYGLLVNVRINESHKSKTISFFHFLTRLIGCIKIKTN